MYDITLIINDDIHKESTLSPIDIFFHYFHIYSKELGLFILDYCNTTHKDSSYFMLCDTMNNLYRFFVKTETDYSYYLFGDIIDNDKNVFIFHNPENKINVFKDDGACTTMPVGSTVLDFAFKLHEDIGLSFDYALLNNNTEHIPAHTQLNQGDAVKIVQKDDYSAEIQWFRYVKNPTSVNSLIKYFAKELSRLKQDKEITITTEDGLPTRIANGATALDVAFQIHEDLGLHFSYALINGKKKHMPAHTLLRDGDYVIIKKANNVSPDLQWFGYVKTRYAVKRLIQYFKKKYNYFN
ncbi:MAG: TGS domain-containing protein [Lachnospiraceae bacterium]|nr:TGS domain-containing protein [Lachnospiraceae bacterium]